MIYDELYDLRQYIISNVGVNAEIGNKDADPNQYPLIKILFDEDGVIHFDNVKTSVIDMPISLRIISDKDDEIEALHTLDKLVRKINQFNDHKGHKLEGSISPEYVDETKTYEINVLYNFKILIQDT
jgi:hypothetical protein